MWGTWEQITDRFVYAAGTKIAGSTGGEETHTLTQSEIPNYKIGDIATIVPPTHTNWNNGGIVGAALGDTITCRHILLHIAGTEQRK